MDVELAVAVVVDIGMVVVYVEVVVVFESNYI